MRSPIEPPPLPKSVDIAIVGAGPQALTLVTRLLQKKKTMRNRFVVIDPAGDWMRQWNYQFAAFEIPHLRSPSVHHPDPDPQERQHYNWGLWHATCLEPSWRVNE